jgi:hypothetical protein
VTGATILPVGGFAVRGRVFLPIGSGVRRAGPLIILSQTGAGRPAAGAIHSRLVLSLSGSGFTPPYEISYRGVKLPRVSAAVGAILPAVRGGLPQVGTERSACSGSLR